MVGLRVHKTEPRGNRIRHHRKKRHQKKSQIKQPCRVHKKQDCTGVRRPAATYFTAARRAMYRPSSHRWCCGNDCKRTFFLQNKKKIADELAYTSNKYKQKRPRFTLLIYIIINILYIVHHRNKNRKRQSHSVLVQDD